MDNDSGALILLIVLIVSAFLLILIRFAKFINDKRVQGLLNFYKQINTYLQINVNVIKSKVTGDKRGYTVAFDRKD